MTVADPVGFALISQGFVRNSAYPCEAVHDGSNVNASFPDMLGSNLSFSPAYGTFTRVDFDVALTAEQSGGAGGSLKVSGFASAEAGGRMSSQTVSRVVFAVPVRLPDGDQAKRVFRRPSAARASGLAWLGLAWLGLAWLGLAWLGLAWLGMVRLQATTAPSALQIFA